MAEVRYRENLDIYQRLAAISPQVYEPDLAMVQNNLGTLYEDTRRYGESEEMFLSVMEIRRRLVAANPQVYEPDLAGIQNNLGILYKDTQRYEDSEKMYLSAMEIYRRLAAVNPQVYEPDLAMAQSNLGTLYKDTRRYEDSEKLCLSAMEIRRRLAAANPQVYEPYLVRACNNLSFLFLAQGNFEEAERYAREGAKYDSTHHTIIQSCGIPSSSRSICRGGRDIPAIQGRAKRGLSLGFRRFLSTGNYSTGTGRRCGTDKKAVVEIGRDIHSIGIAAGAD